TEHGVLEIGAQKLAHRRDVVIEAEHEISEDVFGVVSSPLRCVWGLPNNDTGMQIAHLGEEVLRVAVESVYRTQQGTRDDERSRGVRNDGTGMEIVHLGEEVLRVAVGSVYRTQGGKLRGEMSMGDFCASPGEPKKATEGSRDRVEHSQGKGIKLRMDERDDGGA